MILLFYLAWVLLVVSVPIFVVIRLVARLTGAQQLITRPKEGAEKFRHLPLEISQFLAVHSLSQIDILQFGKIIFAFYGIPPGPPPERYIVVMLAKGRFVTEVITRFSDETSLTTTRSNNAFSLPRPLGAYIQGFMSITLDQLWAKHLEAELFLLEQVGVVVVPRNLTFDRAEVTERALRKQGAFVKATPLFWLKAPYWVFIKRRLMVNKSVAQQLRPKGELVRQKS